jgi:hypothetical protein
MQIKSQAEWLNEKIFAEETNGDISRLPRKVIYDNRVKLGRMKDYEIDLAYSTYKKHELNEYQLDQESKGGI